MAKRKVTPEENRALPSTHPDFDPWQYSRDVERLGLVGRLGAAPYATLRTIAGHINDKPENRRYGKAWMSEDTLAAELGISERQVREHIKRLVKGGLIAVHKEKGRAGNRNEYELLPLTGVRLPMPPKPANLAQLQGLNRRQPAALQNGGSPPFYQGRENGGSPPPKPATPRRFKPAVARRLKRRQPAAEVPRVSPQRKYPAEVPSPEGGGVAGSAASHGTTPNGTHLGDAAALRERVPAHTPLPAPPQPTAPTPAVAAPPPRTPQEMTTDLFRGLAAARVLHPHQIGEMQGVEVRRWDAERLVLATPTPQVYQAAERYKRDLQRLMAQVGQWGCTVEVLRPKPGTVPTQEDTYAP